MNNITSEMLIPAYTWSVTEINSPLQSSKEVDEAVQFLDNLGLPRHGDRPKNWDNLIALVYAAMHMDPGGLILDAGVGDDSAFLTGLRRLGFRNLVGCNIDIRGSSYVDGVGYEYGNIESLRFGCNTVDFIACLSVIEHGVNVDRFLSEAARVLRPGGMLAISTDYWQAPIDTGDRNAFGAPVKIFSPNDIVAMVAEARRLGLELVGFPGRSLPGLICADRTIDWIGLSYTFLNLMLVKRHGPRTDAA